MDITRRLHNKVGEPRRHRETILLLSKAISSLMVRPHPSREAGGLLLQVDNRATALLRRTSMVPLRPKVNTSSSRRLVNMALLRLREVMASLHRNNTALLRHSNSTALLHSNSNTALLPSSNMVPREVDLLLNLHWVTEPSKRQTSMCLRTLKPFEKP